MGSNKERQFERRNDEVEERERITGYLEVGGKNEGEMDVELIMEGDTIIGMKGKEVGIGSSGGQENESFRGIKIVQC